MVKINQYRNKARHTFTQKIQQRKKKRKKQIGIILEP